MRFPHNDALTLHQVRAVRNGSRVTAGTVVCASPAPPPVTPDLFRGPPVHARKACD